MPSGSSTCTSPENATALCTSTRRCQPMPWASASTTQTGPSHPLTTMPVSSSTSRLSPPRTDSPSPTSITPPGGDQSREPSRRRFWTSSRPSGPSTMPLATSHSRIPAFSRESAAVHRGPGDGWRRVRAGRPLSIRGCPGSLRTAPCRPCPRPGPGCWRSSPSWSQVRAAPSSAGASWASSATAAAAVRPAWAPSSEVARRREAWPSWPFSPCGPWVSGAASGPSRSWSGPWPKTAREPARGSSPTASESPLSGEAQDPKGLGVAQTGGTTTLSGPLAHDGAHRVGGAVDLADVAEEGLDLGFDRPRDVDPRVGLERPREIDGVDPVRRARPGEVQRAPGRGGDGVEGGPPHGAVVPVVEVALTEEHRRGVGAHDGVGTNGPDQPHQLGAEVGGLLEVAVGVIEAVVAGQAQHGRGGV